MGWWEVSCCSAIHFKPQQTLHQNTAQVGLRTSKLSKWMVLSSGKKLSNNLAKSSIFVYRTMTPSQVNIDADFKRRLDASSPSVTCEEWWFIPPSSISRAAKLSQTMATGIGRGEQFIPQKKCHNTSKVDNCQSPARMLVKWLKICLFGRLEVPNDCSVKLTTLCALKQCLSWLHYFDKPRGHQIVLLLDPTGLEFQVIQLGKGNMRIAWLNGQAGE